MTHGPQKTLISVQSYFATIYILPKRPHVKTSQMLKNAIPLLGGALIIGLPRMAHR